MNTIVPIPDKVERHNSFLIFFTTLITLVQQYKHRKRIRKKVGNMTSTKRDKVGPAGRARTMLPLRRMKTTCRPASILTNMNASSGG